MPRALAIGLALVFASALAPIAAGCGSDDENGQTTTDFEITVPSGKATKTTEETTPTVPEVTTTPPSDTSGSGGTSVNPAKPDSPSNDVPPEPGSPESKFEQYCDQNPGACG